MGAMTGAIIMTCIRSEKIRAEDVTSQVSAMIARGATSPAAAPIACKKRAASSHSTVGAQAAITDPTTKMAMPTRRGSRRP